LIENHLCQCKQKVVGILSLTLCEITRIFCADKPL
jgi:hypothetical protein